MHHARNWRSGNFRHHENKRLRTKREAKHRKPAARGRIRRSTEVHDTNATELDGFSRSQIAVSRSQDSSQLDSVGLGRRRQKIRATQSHVTVSRRSIFGSACTVRARHVLLSQHKKNSFRSPFCNSYLNMPPRKKATNAPTAPTRFSTRTKAAAPTVAVPAAAPKPKSKRARPASDDDDDAPTSKPPIKKAKTKTTKANPDDDKDEDEDEDEPVADEPAKMVNKLSTKTSLTFQG